MMTPGVLSHYCFPFIVLATSRFYVESGALNSFSFLIQKMNPHTEGGYNEAERLVLQPEIKRFVNFQSYHASLEDMQLVYFQRF